MREEIIVEVSPLRRLNTIESATSIYSLGYKARVFLLLRHVSNESKNEGKYKYTYPIYLYLHPTIELLYKRRNKIDYVVYLATVRAKY